ncbi:unnamed protein product [Clavelina lepadiformis]|uniref:Uncharacterized protein n=1 Tax=Clavelina lepadiformis TaxID=159417 RepID=A0ABP0FAV1_CLALP
MAFYMHYWLLVLAELATMGQKNFVQSVNFSKSWTWTKWLPCRDEMACRLERYRFCSNDPTGKSCGRVTFKLYYQAIIGCQDKSRCYRWRETSSNSCHSQVCDVSVTNMCTNLHNCYHINHYTCNSKGYIDCTDQWSKWTRTRTCEKKTCSSKTPVETFERRCKISNETSLHCGGIKDHNSLQTQTRPCDTNVTSCDTPAMRSSCKDCSPKKPVNGEVANTSLATIQIQSVQSNTATPTESAVPIAADDDNLEPEDSALGVVVPVVSSAVVLLAVVIFFVKRSFSSGSHIDCSNRSSENMVNYNDMNGLSNEDCKYVRPYTLPCKHQHMLCKQFPINTQMENAYEDLSFYNMDSSFTKTSAGGSTEAVDYTMYSIFIKENKGSRPLPKPVANSSLQEKQSIMRCKSIHNYEDVSQLKERGCQPLTDTCQDSLNNDHVYLAPINHAHVPGKADLPTDKHGYVELEL